MAIGAVLLVSARFEVMIFTFSLSIFKVLGLILVSRSMSKIYKRFFDYILVSFSIAILNLK